MGHNRLTLAAAGSRKTQSIVEACGNVDKNEKILILTYTELNQNELRRRISKLVGDTNNVIVLGWFAFLIRYFAKPYMPFLFPNTRITGFDFHSSYMTYKAKRQAERYLTSSGLLRRPHLAQLSYEIVLRSAYEPIQRLARMYTHIYIDEVQDLCGYDLEILDMLMKSDCALTMVGDVRQAILSTNPQEKKNSKYRSLQVWSWFTEREHDGLLLIEHRCETWRCQSEIAAFADSLFGPEFGFQPTTSLNETTTGHDGIFFVRKNDVRSYVDEYQPLFLRHSSISARDEPYVFMNIGLSKGLTSQRVLIWPTKPIENFLTKRTKLTIDQSMHLYVAVTRAEQSVAIVMDDCMPEVYPLWIPTL